MERVGGWRCLDCAHIGAAVIDEGSLPTCGQREVMYCPACNALKCHEFTMTNVAPPQRNMQMPTATGFHPTQQQIDRIRGASDSGPRVAVVRSPAVTSSTDAIEGSARFPDPKYFSDMTIEALQELQKHVLLYSDTITKEMSERKLCIVCYNSPKEVIFYPCKHKCLCRQCGEKVSQCPVCRVSIADRILPFDA